MGNDVGFSRTDQKAEDFWGSLLWVIGNIAIGIIIEE